MLIRITNNTSKIVVLIIKTKAVAVPLTTDVPRNTFCESLSESELRSGYATRHE